MNKKQKKTGFNKGRGQTKFKSVSVTIVLTVALLGVIGVLAARNGNVLSGAGPLMKVNLIGEVNRDGEKITLDQAKAVKPNEILHWTIVSKNEGEGEAKEYKAVGKIPQGTIYVTGSANAENPALVKFSLDDGKSFSEKPLIEEKQADGSVKQIPAPVEMFTNVSFEWKSPVSPSEERIASYDVRVK